MTLTLPDPEQDSDAQIIQDLIQQIHAQQELIARVEAIVDGFMKSVELDDLPVDVKVHRVIHWIGSGKYARKQKKEIKPLDKL